MMHNTRHRLTGIFLAICMVVTVLSSPIGAITAHAATSTNARGRDLPNNIYSLPEIREDHIFEDTTTNVYTAIRFTGKISSKMYTIEDIILRMMELTEEAENGTLTPNDINNIYNQIDELNKELQQTYEAAVFNGFQWITDVESVYIVPVGDPNSCHNAIIMPTMRPLTLSDRPTIEELQNALSEADIFLMKISDHCFYLNLIHQINTTDINNAENIFTTDILTGNHEPISLSPNVQTTINALDTDITRAYNALQNTDIPDIDKQYYRYQLTLAIGTKNIIADMVWEDNAIYYTNFQNSMWVETYVWDGDTTPTGPDENPNWSHYHDTPVGDTVYYRIVVSPGMTKTVGMSHNLILSNLIERVSPDYDTLKVYQAGQQLTAGQDYRLYTSDFRNIPKDLDPSHIESTIQQINLRNIIQDTFGVYYTFGLIFDNSLCGKVIQENVDKAMNNEHWSNTETLYIYEPIVITFEARVDDDAYLASELDGYIENAYRDMPTYLVEQRLTSTIGWAHMDMPEFDNIVHSAGNDPLPRYAQARNADIEEMERTGTWDANNTDADETGGYLVTDTAAVYNYGFDVVKIDDESKLLEDAYFQLKLSETGDPIEFVQTGMTGVSWYEDDNGNYSHVDANGLQPIIYRLATDQDDPSLKTTTIKAGYAILVGLDSELYYLVETKSPSGYNKFEGTTTIQPISVQNVLLPNAGIDDMGPIRDTEMSDDMASLQSASLDAAANSRGQISPGGIISIGSMFVDIRQDMFTLLPIQVNGDGYDLSEYDYYDKCVSGKAFFTYDTNGEFPDTPIYTGEASIWIADYSGNYSTIEGTAENPFYGGVAVMNQKSSALLPTTGGEGVGIYYMLGACTIGLGFIAITIKRKK